MESDDEEVIFENLAVHQALREIGVENLDTEPVAYNDDVTPGTQDMDEKTGLDMTKDNVHRIQTGFLTKMFLSQEEIISVYDSYQRKTVDRLKSSPLLLNDDRIFLQSFMDDEADENEEANEIEGEAVKYTEPPTRPCLNLFRVLALNLTLCFAVFMSYLVIAHEPTFIPPDFTHLMLMYGSMSYSFVCPAVGLTLLVCLLKILLYCKLRYEINKLDGVIKEFEKSASGLSRIERKCVRRIRESELVARGFTLASLPLGSNADSHLLTQIDELCPNFRTALFDGNIEVIEHLKNSYKNLTESVPLIVDFNWLDSRNTSSSSGLDMESGSASDEVDNDDGAGVPVDNMLGRAWNIKPTSQLVSSHELLSLHISTFVRRIILSFFSDNFKDKRANPYKAVSKSVHICQQSIDSLMSVLTRNHAFYRAIHESLERPDVPVVPAEDRKSKSPLDSFYVCVNSLDLHLQAVFKTARDLTIHLEALVEENDASTEGSEKSPGVEGIGAEDRAAWEGTLKRIRSGLDSCKSCYEEALKLLHQTGAKASSVNIAIPNPSHNSPSTSKEAGPSHRPLIIIPDSDPVIEDQVFEAVIDSDVEEEEKLSRPTYTAEEKAQHRQQREDLTRFKQELKAVVDYRAINQRKREEKALAKTQGKETPPTSSSETGESLGGRDGDDEGEGGASAQGTKKLEKSFSAHKKNNLDKSTDSEEDKLRKSRDASNEVFERLDSSQGEKLDKARDSGKDVFERLSSSEGEKLDRSSDEGEKMLEKSNHSQREMLEKSSGSQREMLSEQFVHSQEENPGTSNQALGAASGYSERSGSQSSLLAAKLDPANFDKCIGNPPDSPMLQLLSSDSTCSSIVNGSPPCTPPTNQSRRSPSRGHNSASAMPFDEGWRSSIEKRKAHHWKMCEKIIQENKDADTDHMNFQSIPLNHDLDSSSFVDISSSEYLLLYPPIDTDTDSNVGASAARPGDKYSTTSSNSQIVCPHRVDPETEGFRNVGGAYVSRHNFTASERQPSSRQNRGTESDEDDEFTDEMGAARNPNRRRHRAERQGGGPNGKWVNISHLEFVSGNGNQYEVFRQKDLTSEDIASRNPIPSPDPCSSLNSSLAFMAAARSRLFNLGVEEEYHGDGQVAEDACDVLCSTELNDDVHQEIPRTSEVA